MAEAALTSAMDAMDLQALRDAIAEHADAISDTQTLKDARALRDRLAKAARKAAKKGSSTAEKDESWVVCEGCAVRVGKEHRVVCKCTRVVFCTEECAEQCIASGRHDCPGPPTADDFAELFRVADEAHKSAKFKAEHASIMRRMGIGTEDGPKMPTLDEMMRCADAGNAACAYLAGIQLSQRQLMVDFRAGVLQSDALAVKYLTQAAEAGIGLAMYSLSNKYQEGDGVRKNVRTSRTWLWKAALVGSDSARDTLDRLCLLSKEVKSHSESLDKFMSSGKLPPGAGPVHMQGPNLGTLLLALKPNLAAHNFTLPPPQHSHTGGVADASCTGPILGTDAIRANDRTLERARARGNTICLAYGRRGTENAETTRLTLEGASDQRLIGNERFKLLVPVEDAFCDELSLSSIESWKRSARDIGIEVNCVHSRGKPLRVCNDCILHGAERLRAAARGQVALSLAEKLEGRGFVAIYRNGDDELVRETFKDYSLGEVETMLACLAADRHCHVLAHPLFIAQDPNLLWPTLFYHGSVRAAMSFVAPHINWVQVIGSPASQPQRQPLLPAPWDMTLRRCGNEDCNVLEVKAGDKSKAMLVCAKCSRRRYCCRGCQRIDWKIHKLECATTTPVELA